MCVRSCIRSCIHTSPVDAFEKYKGMRRPVASVGVKRNRVHRVHVFMYRLIIVTKGVKRNDITTRPQEPPLAPRNAQTVPRLCDGVPHRLCAFSPVVPWWSERYRYTSEVVPYPTTETFGYHYAGAKHTKLAQSACQ